MHVYVCMYVLLADLSKGLDMQTVFAIADIGFSMNEKCYYKKRKMVFMLL